MPPGGFVVKDIAEKLQCLFHNRWEVHGGWPTLPPAQVLTCREKEAVLYDMLTRLQNFSTKVHLLSSGPLASEFEVLGTSILAHLSAIPIVFSKADIADIPSPTIEWFGRFFRNPDPETRGGYSNSRKGKAFEYAVAELFNNRSEPYYSLIYQGIDRALSTRVSPRVRKVSRDIDQLSCARVAWECADAEDLIGAFGRFRILRDARRSIENAVRTFPGLTKKIDVIFYDREAETASRFAILASLKINREEFLKDDVQRDFRDFPVDLAISVETPRYREVGFEAGVHVVYLPMHHVVSGVHFWKMATTIVERALLEGERNRILRFFQQYFRPNTPENRWVEFLADRLQADINHVVQEIRQMLDPRERIVTAPTLLGAEEDVMPDLVTP